MWVEENFDIACLESRGAARYTVFLSKEQAAHDLVARLPMDVLLI